MCCIFCFLCEGGDFNAMIDFRELPMEYEHEFRKQIWNLRNPGKLLPNSEEARRKMQKLKQAEKESVERKKLLRLMKKKAVKAVKKEADKDGKDEAEEEDVDIPQVGLLTSCTATVKNHEQKHDYFSVTLYSCQIFRFPNLRRRSRKKRKV